MTPVEERIDHEALAKERESFWANRDRLYGTSSPALDFALDWIGALLTEHSAREEAEREFLDASVAVWRSIDEREAMPGGYAAQPLTADTELRRIERQAWERYRDALPSSKENPCQ